MKSSTLKDRLIKINYGGRDREFYDGHINAFHEHNENVAFLFNSVITGVLLIYSLIGYFFLQDTVQVYVVTGCSMLILLLIYVFLIKGKPAYTPIYVQTLVILFTIALLYIDFSAPNEYSIFVPVFAAILPVSLMLPLTSTFTYLILLLLVTAGGSAYFKPELAVFDVIDVFICGFVGVMLGASILETRVNEIYLLEARAGRREDVIRTLASEYFALFTLNLDTQEFKVYSVEPSLSLKYADVLAGNSFDAIKTAYAAGDIVSEDRELYIHTSDPEYIREQLKHMKSFAQRYRINTENGFEYCEARFIRIDPEGILPNNVVAAYANIDAMYRKSRQDQADLEAARNSATTDALTGALNRVAFNKAVDGLTELIKERASAPFSIVMCDLNYLKETNDKYGHLEGDRLLKEVYAFLSRCFKGCAIYRVGGDEFAAVLTGKDHSNRQDLVDKARASTNGVRHVAVGIGDYNPETDADADAVLRKADADMYADKANYKSGIS